MSSTFDDFLVQCDKCDRWRYLTPEAFHLLQSRDTIYCWEIYQCSCQEKDDDADQETIDMWTNRGGRTLVEFVEKKKLQESQAKQKTKTQQIQKDRFLPQWQVDDLKVNEASQQVKPEKRKSDATNTNKSQLISPRIIEPPVKVQKTTTKWQSNDKTQETHKTKTAPTSTSAVTPSKTQGQQNQNQTQNQNQNQIPTQNLAYSSHIQGPNPMYPGQTRYPTPLELQQILNERTNLHNKVKSFLSKQIQGEIERSLRIPSVAAGSSSKEVQNNFYLDKILQSRLMEKLRECNLDMSNQSQDQKKLDPNIKDLNRINDPKTTDFYLWVCDQCLSQIQNFEKAVVSCFGTETENLNEESNNDQTEAPPKYPSTSYALQHLLTQMSKAYIPLIKDYYQLVQEFYSTEFFNLYEQHIHRIFRLLSEIAQKTLIVTQNQESVNDSINDSENLPSILSYEEFRSIRLALNMKVHILKGLFGDEKKVWEGRRGLGSGEMKIVNVGVSSSFSGTSFYDNIPEIGMRQ